MNDAPQLKLERSVLMTVGLGGMLIPLNSTMVAVALPNITRQLDASVTQTGWLITAYLIVMAAFQPIAGKLGDRYGRRAFLLGGYAVFGASSVLAALAPNAYVLIACRAGQALAGSVIFPNGSALLRLIVPEERRGARFGLLGASIGFGAAIGPPLGGVLVELGDWPATFWANVPLCLLILGIASRTLPRDEQRRSTERFDLVGAILLAMILSCGAWLLTGLTEVGSTVVIGVTVAIAIATAVFVMYELRRPDPVMQPRFFRRRVFASATAAIACSNIALYVLLLAVPLILAGRRGWSEARIGLALTTMSVGMVVLAPIGGRLSDRLGRRTPAFIGMSLLAVGVLTITFIGSDIGTFPLVVCLALSGIGLGLGSGSLQTSAVESIEPEHAGMSSGAASTARYVGSIVGTAILAGTAASGFAPVLTVTAVGAVAAVFLTLGLSSRPPRQARRESDAIAT